jgi:PD-(D/E)XK endonuclease
VSEGVVLAHLLKRGYVALLPFGNNQRYDFVIDDGDTFVRAQVKTGRLKDGIVIFKTSSVNGFTDKRTTCAGRRDLGLLPRD